jgi:Mrp family chromosome partitioning ATPase/capsular polysaccharide biosynthesis protein
MNDSTTDAASVFAPIWKRKWIILLVAILVAAGTYEYYKKQAPSYAAKTSLYLGGASEQAAGTNSNQKALSGRELTNQVELINSGLIGAPVRRALRAEGNIAAAKAKAKAIASATASFITITTEAHTPRAAIDLGNAYARGFIARERADYFRNVKNAISNARQQLRRLEVAGSAKGSKGANGAANTLQSATLASKINQLEEQLANFTGVQQVGAAKASPLPLSPAPKKNAEFGFVLGLLLAAVVAYILAQFDRRIGSLSDIERIFQAQILTALPKVRSPVVRPGGERAPARPLLEPLRRLATTLQLGDVLGREGAPRSIVFVSADPGDGRSSLVTNLARVQRDSGARVAVIEADFRRPVLGRMLDVSSPHGLGDVVTHRVTLDEAIRDVEPVSPLIDGAAPGVAAASTVVASRSTGALSVLLAGDGVENPPALLASTAMADLVRSISEEYDYVLIDAPPPLAVSDVMPLLPLVDGVLIVARVHHTRAQSARRLVQVLGRTASAPLLGVVANCVSDKDIERYGFLRAPSSPRTSRKLFGR